DRRRRRNARRHTGAIASRMRTAAYCEPHRGKSPCAGRTGCGASGSAGAGNGFGIFLAAGLLGYHRERHGQQSVGTAAALARWSFSRRQHSLRYALYCRRGYAVSAAGAQRRRQPYLGRPGHAGLPGRRKLSHLEPDRARRGADSRCVTHGIDGVGLMLEAVGRIASEIVIGIAERVRTQSLARSMADLVALLVAVVLLYQIYLFAWVLWYSVFNPGSSAYMREQAGILADQDRPVSIQYEWTPSEAISPARKKAGIAAEDARFTEHGGVEWEAIRKAWRYNERQEEAGRNRRRGGS